MFTMKNKEIALTLCLLPTGWIGIHHFYLKNYVKFVLYLLTFWLLIPIFLSLIDGYTLYKMDEKVFVKKYCSEEEFNAYMSNKTNSLYSTGEFDISELNEEQKNEIKKQIFQDELDNEGENKEDNKIENNQEESEDEIEPDFSDYYGPWMNEDE